MNQIDFLPICNSKRVKTAEYDGFDLVVKNEDCNMLKTEGKRCI